MELTKIIKYLDKKFNEKIAAKWDNVGIQQLDEKPFRGWDQEINKVIVCLDVTKEVIESAIENKVQLIISRHPFLFDDLEADRKRKKSLIKLLIKNDILIYSIHTNYDASANQNLLNLLQTKFSISKTSRIGVEHEGYEVKLKAPISVKEYVENLQNLFPTDYYQINKNFVFDNKIKAFNIVTGAGGSTLIDENLSETYFVTGEMKWHELVYANDHQVSVLLLGHYMENYFVEHLQQMLTQNFHDLVVVGFDIGNQIKDL